MLVVTLREDEFINVSGGPVTITLVKVSGKQVRIGIACAREHEIHRSNDNRRQTPLIPLVGQLEGAQHDRATGNRSEGSANGTAGNGSAGGNE